MPRGVKSSSGPRTAIFYMMKESNSSRFVILFTELFPWEHLSFPSRGTPFNPGRGKILREAVIQRGLGGEERRHDWDCNVDG